MLVKDYKVNEAVLVTYYTLEALYQKYSYNYPNKIQEKVFELVDTLENELNGHQNKDYTKRDIKQSYYVERIVFENETNF